MSARLRPSHRRLAGAAALAAAGLLAAAACTDTNVTGPGTARGGILFASDRGGRGFEIRRVSAEGGPVERVTDDGEHNDFAPALSPDGSRIAWEREIASPSGLTTVEIWVMDADGGNARAVVGNGSENRTPSWTPDGSALVYASFVTGNWEIFRTELASGASRNLTESPFADQAPRVSPDGATIAFHSNRDVQFEIYAMDADGGNQRNLTNDPADDRYPAWTPDGATIVWSRFLDSFDIWAMAANGSAPRAVAETAFQELRPAVSPDGRSVVYQTNRYPPQGLEVMPLAGGAARALATELAGSGSDLQPFWGPER